jgi:class 3 adenylate cyclase/tetratricopeptide (TPR) repeat protein
VLAVAAVLGSGWDIDTLVSVTGADGGALAMLLDEAEQGEILVRTDGRYDFAHPLYERAALAVLSSRRRQEIHGHVATMLIERQASRPESSMMPIAQHLVEAGGFAEPEMLIRYCPGAGASAFAGFAWGDAARYYEAALGAHERTGDASDESRVALALRASAARLQNGEPAAALTAADAALRALDGNSSREEAAAVWSARVRADLFSTGPGGPVEIGPLETLVGPLETEAPAAAARVYGTLAAVYANVTRDVDSARAACHKAIDLGSRNDEYTAAATGWGQLAVTQWMRFELLEAVESFRSEADHASRVGDREKLSHALSLLPVTLFWLGRIDEAEDAIEHARMTTRQVNYFLHDGFVLVARAAIAAVRGMYTESDAAVEDAVEIGRLTGDQWPTILILSLLAATRAQRGDAEGLEAVLAQWAPVGSLPDRTAFAWLLRAYVDAAAGTLPSPEGLRDAWKPLATPARVSSDAAAVLIVDLARDVDARDVAGDAADLLRGLADRGQVFTTTMGLFIPRSLGLAAAVLGDQQRAISLLRQSVTDAARLRAHAEVAACQEALAWVLAQSGSNADEVGGMLVETHRSARAIGLGTVARRCETTARRIGVDLSGTEVRVTEPRATSARGTTDMAVVLFTDIANSVQLTEEMGDWAFHDQARALQTSLRATIRSHDGAPIEGIKLGDGILAEFRSAERALRCALACQDVAIHAGMPLHIGAHAGDVIRSDGDIFGGAVNTAARICSTAAAGEVLVSQTLRDLARTSSGLDFESLGPHTMKGISEPVPLYAVHPH